ncbi:MAG: dihydroxyacetone kinase [Mycoplasmatales bacterium]|nr:dihydroxyacetone kinase [Mycoplasmatales bacterium]
MILVSHDDEFANAAKKYILKMINASNSSKIIPVGGDAHGGLGSDYKKIINAIQIDSEDTLIICDLGSAVLSSKIASTYVKNKVHVSSGSLIEGAFAAATLMFANDKFENVIAASEEKIFK